MSEIPRGPAAMLLTGYAITHALVTNHYIREPLECPEPSASDYAAVDGLLQSPPRFLLDGDTVRFAPPQPETRAGVFFSEAINGPVIEHGDGRPNQDFARSLGATIFSDTFYQSLMEGRASGQSNAELFEQLQHLTKEHYGIDLVNRTGPEVLRNTSPEPAAEPALAEPVDTSTISDNEVMDMYMAVSSIPVETYRAGSVDTIIAYELRRDSNGGGKGGYYSPFKPNVVNTVVGFESLEHEVVHALDLRYCGDAVMADPAFTAHNSQPVPRGTELADAHGMPYLAGPAGASLSEEVFKENHGAEIITELNLNDDDIRNNRTWDEAQAVIAERYPDQAARIDTVTEYGKESPMEDKAEILENVIGERTDLSLNTLMSPTKTNLRAKTRLLLARLHAMSPGAARYSIVHSYDYPPEAFEQAGDK